MPYLCQLSRKIVEYLFKGSKGSSDGSLQRPPALGAPLAVSMAAIGMQLTKTMHPPAGGTALIAVLGSDTINRLGFEFLLPVGYSSIALLAIGYVFNNVHPARRKFPRGSGRWW